MEKTIISVIVPAYNVEAWIKNCLKSVCDQTYRDLEIIVIDDGSTDRTGEIIDLYAKKDPRIIAIHQKNSGLVAVRELGIQISNGQYIGFVDGDDTIEPDMYERLLTNAINYQADISHCGMSFCTVDGQKEPHYGTGETRIQDNYQGQIDLLKGSQVEPSLCCKLYRAELLIHSCLDQTILNNEDLLRNFVAFQRAERSVYEDFCGYNYIQRESSMSNDRSKRLQSLQNIFQARKLIAANASEDVKPFAMSSWLGCTVNAVNQLMYCREPESSAYCSECRAFLKKHRGDLHYLIARQQIAAWGIIYAPQLHELLYKIYQKVNKR